MTKANKVIEAEIWRNIKGFGEAYQISSMGRVRSVDRVINLTNGKQRHVSGHLITSHDNGLGYRQVNLMDADHKLHAMLVHRLVLSAFINISDNEASMAKLSDVDHIDNDRTNNRLNNLRLISHADNLRKASRMKQIRQSVHCVDANGEIVIKAESMTAMAELLGVSQATISSHVNSGKPLSTGLKVVRDNDTDKQANTAKEVA